MKKRYGDTNTNLTLSSKAQKFYNETDPISIYEIETDNGFVYDIDFCGKTDKDLTSEQVNNYLESLYNESIT